MGEVAFVYTHQASNKTVNWPRSKRELIGSQKGPLKR